MARKNPTTDSAIQHDGGADTFLTRQGEILRHWAEPRIEAALAWGEAGTAFGEVGTTVAAEEGRRRAKDVKQDMAPLAERAGKAVAGGLGAVAPVVAKQKDGLHEFFSALQDQAAELGEEFTKEAESARKAAKKAGKRGAKKTKQVRKDARGAAKKADTKADVLGFLTAQKAGKAKDAAAKGGLTAAGLLAAAVAAVQDQGEKLAPQVQERLAEASRYAEQRREEFAPVAASRLADVAGSARQTAHDVQVPTSVEQALIALTRDKKIVAKLRKGAEHYAGQTEKDLKRTARKADRSERAGGRGWIVAGMAAAAAGAGFAIWKLTKPVQDPWAAPTPGPITANIPVVERGAANDPYAKQREAVAEATGHRVVGQGQAVADADARVLGEPTR